jgi:hypothetical protein
MLLPMLLPVSLPMLLPMILPIIPSSSIENVAETAIRGGR